MHFPRLDSVRGASYEAKCGQWEVAQPSHPAAEEASSPVALQHSHLCENGSAAGTASTNTQQACPFRSIMLWSVKHKFTSIMKVAARLTGSGKSAGRSRVDAT